MRNRRKLMPEIPQTCSFDIPDIYKKDFLNCDRLLLHDSADPHFQVDQSLYTRPEGRVLVWSSDLQLNLLFNSEKLYMDGTFSTAPPNFEQVYIIQVIHHETCELLYFIQYAKLLVYSVTIGIPAVCALLPNKKAATYSYLFHILFSQAKK